MRGLSRLARLALPLRRHGYLSRTAPRGRLCPEAATLSPRRRARIWQHMRSGAVTTFPGEQQSARDASRGPVSGKGAVSPLRLDVLATVPMGQSAEAPLGVVRLPQSAGAALSRRLVWTAGSRPARARHRARSGPLHPRESNGDRPRSRQVKAAGAGDGRVRRRSPVSLGLPQMQEMRIGLCGLVTGLRWMQKRLPVVSDAQ
jgi:hypothetical protein